MKTFSMMDVLKRSTEEDHAAIERALNLPDPTLTLISYRTLLERFYGYYAPWERICRPSVDQFLPGFFDKRLRTPLLERDLAFLGGGDVHAITECLNVPAVRSLAQALGSMYVVEGSTLGGRLLSRHFSDALGVEAETGGMFFAGYGGRTGAMWREFAAIVETHLPSSSATEGVEAAQNTFRTLREWLA